MKVMAGFVIASAAVMAVSGESRACSPNRCAGEFLVPVEGARVPASAAVMALRRGVGPPGPERGDPILRDAQGQVVPTDVLPSSGGLIRPRVPLSVGTYTLEAPAGGCAANLVTRFEVTSAAPIPTTLGAVVVSPAEQRTLTIHSGDSCVRTAEASVAGLDIVPSAELEPFLPVVRYRLVVDGKLWVQTDWGLESHHLFGSVHRRADEVFSRCPQDLSDSGVPPGTHRAELTAEIGGVGAVLGPVVFTFETSCGGSRDAGGDAALRDADARASDAGAAPGGGMEKGGGCGIAGRPAAATPALLIVLGATLLLRRARRRP